jgi:serine/threonine protein kinase
MKFQEYNVEIPIPLTKKQTKRMSIVASLDEESFELIKLIGQGSFGEVYLARHIGYNKFCAMKKIRKDLILQNDGLKGIRTER